MTEWMGMFWLMHVKSIVLCYECRMNDINKNKKLDSHQCQAQINLEWVVGGGENQIYC